MDALSSDENLNELDPDFETSLVNPNLINTYGQLYVNAISQKNSPYVHIALANLNS